MVWIALREVEVVVMYFRLFSQHSSGVNGHYKRGSTCRILSTLPETFQTRMCIVNARFMFVENAFGRSQQCVASLIPWKVFLSDLAPHALLS